MGTREHQRDSPIPPLAYQGAEQPDAHAVREDIAEPDPAHTTQLTTLPLGKLFFDVYSASGHGAKSHSVPLAYRVPRPSLLQAFADPL